MAAPSALRSYFTAGGTLPPGAPSYVTRPADAELLRLTRQGAFCYVLTSRQRGKSSLMVRTVERLRQEGVAAAVIDLSGLGTSQLTSDQWYLGMLKRLAERLRLPTDVSAWWARHQSLSPVQRFSEFFREVVLGSIAGPIVVFIDEIDSTLKLDFTDDFFAAIRGFYNARASEPVFERLSFVLLGVASPADLIKNRARTSYNIGTPVELQDLTIDSAQPLIDGLEQIAPGHGRALLERVLFWTGGHPYLTQKVCLAIGEQARPTWDSAAVDALVRALFLSADSPPDDNLQTVRASVAASAERREIMQLYQRVFTGERVQVDERSVLQNQLRLIGLATADRDQLRVHNRIYREVFGAAWIRANTPVNWSRRVIIGAGLIILVAVVSTILIVSRQRQAAIADERERVLAAAVPTNRLFELGKLCALSPEAARAVFAELAPPEQMELFEPALVRSSPGGMRDAVLCLYQPDPDLSPARDLWTPPLRMAMCRAVEQLDDAAELRDQARLDCPEE